MEELSASRILGENDLFADLWNDAEMGSVLVYLRGGVGLQLPEDWQTRLESVRGWLRGPC